MAAEQNGMPKCIRILGVSKKALVNRSVQGAVNSSELKTLKAEFNAGFKVVGRSNGGRFARLGQLGCNGILEELAVPQSRISPSPPAITQLQRCGEVAVSVQFDFFIGPRHDAKTLQRLAFSIVFDLSHPAYFTITRSFRYGVIHMQTRRLEGRIDQAQLDVSVGQVDRQLWNEGPLKSLAAWGRNCLSSCPTCRD